MAIEDVSNGVALLTLTGRLDAAGVAKVEMPITASLAPKGKSVIIDLSGVSFVASLGLRMLVSLARTLSHKKASVVLFGAGEMVAEVMETAALDDILPLVADRTAAEAHLAG